jgi:hypothetical protein
MKGRAIRTRFWDDDTVQSVSPNSRYIWMFLLTNKEVGMTNYFKMPEPFFCYYTGLDPKAIRKCKEELEATGKIFFKGDWIFIPKLEDLNNYANSPKNIIAYANEKGCVPKEIIEYFSDKYTPMDSSIDSGRHSDEKLETRNKKLEIRNKKSKEEVLGEGVEYEF